MNFNENIFEYLLWFAYFLFFIGITNSILKFIYNWLLNFNLEKSKNWFKLKKFFDRNKSYYNFYEYYNRSFSKFYNEKKSMNIDSIIFFKDLIKYSIKNNKVINRNEYLFTKWRESAVKSDEKNKELNSLLNVYSLLTQLTVTKNFRDNIIWLISKQRSKFWRHLKRTLNFKNMEQYYLWDYFNQHIFDEMFFNIVLKETSFNTILKDKNKLKNYKLDNFYSNSLFYNKFSNIGISEKNWIFRYDSDFKNIKALKSEIKDMSNISWYSRDWFRSRTEMFDLPTSKLKKKLKLIKSQQIYIYSLDWDFLYYIFKNSFKIFLFFFLIHYIILTELWLTLLTLLTLLVIIILYNIFFRISIKKIITSLITLLLALLFIFIISYILYNIYYIYLYILYIIYNYNISDYLRLINDKNMYTSFILEYLKYNGLVSWIIKCIHLLETKRNNIRFDGFVNLDLLMKEFYLNGFKNWPERSSFDNFFPFFRRWFYKIKIKRNEAEEQENYKIIKEKAIERAKKTLSQINDTATFKSYFDFSFSTLIQEQYYKYLRDPYYKINYVQAHLILWFVQAYNENLAKISKLSKVYENYYYLYLQKTNLILKIYFISKPKYYIYIQKIQWFFYFNRKIIGSVKYILLGMFISILIIFLYLYFILKTYLNLISKNEIITRDFYLIWLNKYHKKILFSDNFIIKTINDSRFINKFRFFLLKQQFKLLAETSNIKIMIK